MHPPGTIISQNDTVSPANKYSYLAVAPCIHMTVLFTGYQIQLSGTMVTQNDIVSHWLPDTAIWHQGWNGMVSYWLPNTAIWHHGYTE